MQIDPNWIIPSIIATGVAWMIFRWSPPTRQARPLPTQHPSEQDRKGGEAAEQLGMFADTNPAHSAANTTTAQEAGKQKSHVEDARATIERARKLVKESGVGVAACELYEASSPWPTWAKRDDWPQWNLLGVSGVEGVGSLVAFTWEGHRWQFTHVRQKNYLSDLDCHLGNLTVNVDGKDVLELAISRRFEEFSKWEPYDVEALAVGDWIADLVRMQVRLELARKHRMAALEAERWQAQAAKIRL